MLPKQDLKKVNPRGKSHMCISCAELVGIYKRSKHTPEGHPIGFVFKSKCRKKKRTRQPWTALPCKEFRENENQKRISDFQWVRKVRGK